jgi:hypothetical protein
MTRGLALITAGLIGVLAIGAPVSAQPRFEFSIGAGYTGSEGISADQRPLLGQVYDTLTPISGASFHFTFGVFLTENAEAEFLWSHQTSRLDAEGPNNVSLPLSDLSVNNYMGNFVYNWGPHDARSRPYFFFGLGTTQYAFGANLLAGSTGNIPNNTRFATNLGGGAKFNFSSHLGANVGIRWTPTYITSTSGGVWCDPFYGCWPLANAKYANQFDTSGAILFRF